MKIFTKNIVFVLLALGMAPSIAAKDIEETYKESIKRTKQKGKARTTSTKSKDTNIGVGFTLGNSVLKSQLDVTFGIQQSKKDRFYFLAALIRYDLDFEVASESGLGLGIGMDRDLSDQQVVSLQFRRNSLNTTYTTMPTRVDAVATEATFEHVGNHLVLQYGFRISKNKDPASMITIGLDRRIGFETKLTAPHLSVLDNANILSLQEKKNSVIASFSTVFK